jgi:phospholipase/lecithinase/hemolysin
VAVEQLAARLGVALAPSALGGTNYAVVGAATGPVIASTSPLVITDNSAAIPYAQPALEGTGMLNQVMQILQTGPIADPAGSLFVVWGGANDLSINPGSAASAISNLSSIIGALYQDGARRFLVPNLPDLSLTPSAQAMPLAVRLALQQLTIGFNAGLAAALASLNSLPGIQITAFDTFAFLNSVIANPGTFGLTNVTQSCLQGTPLTGASVCANPGSYLFWDGLHPTTAGHAILGNAFATAVPEPASLMLIAVGLGAGLRRFRRAPAVGSHSRQSRSPLQR